jgi:hypothetical protein
LVVSRIIEDKDYMDGVIVLSSNDDDDDDDMCINDDMLFSSASLSLI